MFDVQYDPSKYDILLLDLTDQDLHQKVSQILKVEYLGLSKDEVLPTMKGIIWGSYYRLLISLPVKRASKTLNVIFLIDTGSPSTYICAKALEAFDIKDIIPQDIKIKINGTDHVANLSPVTSHFSDINVIGTDFMRFLEAKLIADFETKICELIPKKN